MTEAEPLRATRADVAYWKDHNPPELVDECIKEGLIVVIDGGTEEKNND